MNERSDTLHVAAFHLLLYRGRRTALGKQVADPLQVLGDSSGVSSGLCLSGSESGAQFLLLARHIAAVAKRSFKRRFLADGVRIVDERVKLDTRML